VVFSLAHSLFTFDLAAAGRAAGLSHASGFGSPNGRAEVAVAALLRNRSMSLAARCEHRRRAAAARHRCATARSPMAARSSARYCADNRIIGRRCRTVFSPAHAIDVAEDDHSGYVDLHAHILPAFGVHRSQPSEYLVNLRTG
jgi:hypothetical protein